MHLRESIVIILRMKAFDVANHRFIGGHGKAVLMTVHTALICDEPTVNAGNNVHPVRPQNMQLNRQAFVTDALQIPVTGQKQLTI